jgi:hypothetical protein
LTAPATTSYVCSALKPVIPDVSIRGYEWPEMAALGRSRAPTI